MTQARNADCISPFMLCRKPKTWKVLGAYKLKLNTHKTILFDIKLEKYFKQYVGILGTLTPLPHQN